VDVIAAIDIRKGRCVRLYQGDVGRQTVYADDPVAVARRWQAEGAPLLHVVDLDGAVGGRIVHGELIREIVRAVDVPVQVGGGIRDKETLERVFEWGAARVVLGTSVLRDEAFFAWACRAHPGAVLAGIDARAGKVAVAGWLEQSDVGAAAVAARASACGAAAVVFTDIGRDGTGLGIDLHALEELLDGSQANVIASGGVAGIEDIEALVRLRRPNLAGVIVGRALYDGRIELRSALAAVARLERDIDTR